MQINLHIINLPLQSRKESSQYSYYKQDSQSRLNKSKSSKNIRYEAELYHEFANLLSIDSDLKWRNLSLNHQAEAGADGSIELDLDDLSIRFTIEFQLKPSLPALKKRLRQVKNPLLLVAPRLSQRLLDQCKALKLSVIDLNGRMWLRSHGIRVERPPARAFVCL